MKRPRIRILATGGTIAGSAGSALRRGYRPGQIGVEDLLASAATLEIDAEFDGREIAAIGSQDIGWREWDALYREITAALEDEAVDGVIVTHGTDTAEETAFLLDLALPAGKPVVLVGAMRPADAVGSDGMRNLANAARVAGDAGAAHRGVLVVMSDHVFAAIDVRKAATGGTEAFRGFPRGPIATVTPTSLDWFGPADRLGRPARFPWPESLPKVMILTAYAGMEADTVGCALASGAQGIVLAGLGQGNAPATVIEALAAAKVAVVRSSRVDQGSVDRNLEVDDDELGFVAARALGPAKARILLQVLIASGITDPAAMQSEFDRR
ncbi:L-asparaginase [Tsuneonella deserti]|uniref:L-asparaginase n=1 Tax=Tsuneonella deserti TaxID=2035528 RepID=A0ABQ1SBP2_9SPHN|nr:asparaginase [Tsuneonella deserti]GGD97981.1 L-asparaginase [Tsuneonella deserti]